MSTWSAGAPGILPLPSGRLVRGRGLRRPLPDGPLPEFGVYLLNKQPEPNPKAYIIFAAVLPQFVDRSAGRVPIQMLLLALLAFSIALITDSIWALLASQARHWFAGSRKCSESVGAVGGVAMIGLGVPLAVTGRRA